MTLVQRGFEIGDPLSGSLPNRMVRVLLPAGDNPITCKGKIVWARLEAGSTTGLRYRAGVFFTGVDERAIEKFLAEYVANQPAG